jgi:hypothetical protein
VNAQNGGGSKQITFVSAQDLGDKAFLKAVHGFGIQNSLIDHFPAQHLKTLLEPERRFDFILAHAVLLL